MEIRELYLKEIYDEVLSCRKCMNVNDSYAMDYLHDAFIKVVEKMDAGCYHDEGKLASWVHTVAINSIRTALRHENLCKDKYNRFLSDMMYFYRRDDCDVKNKVVIELVFEVLETLPLADREIVMKYTQKKSLRSIAEEMKKNNKTIKKHLNKSYEIIRILVPGLFYDLCHEEL